MEQFLPDQIASLECFIEKYYYLYRVCDYDILFRDSATINTLKQYFNGELSCEQACDIVSKFSSNQDIGYDNSLLQELVRDSRQNSLPYDQINTKPQPQQFVQEQKQLQITQLAQTLSDTCSVNKDTKIIDMGGGVGHLAREIKRRFPQNEVMVVERQNELIQKGSMINKHLGLGQECAVEFSQITISDQESFDNLNLLSEGQNAIVTGLHTCGNFGVQLCRMFLSSSQRFRHFVQVPCCYQTISWDNFLVSRRFQKLKTFLREQKINLRSFLNVAVGDRPDAARVVPSQLMLINGKKHQRLLFDPILQRISREIGKEQIAKRSRMRGDEDVLQYFKYQLQYLIAKNKPKLDSYTVPKAVEELLADVYKVPLEELQTTWKTDSGLLPELFVLQNIVTRAFEKLLLADRVMLCIESGASVHVSFIPGSPRNTVLTISK